MSSIGDITSSYYDFNSVYGNTSTAGTAATDKLVETLDGIDVEDASDEELLEVCGGNGVDNQVLNDIKNLLCKRATSEEECNQYDFCSWLVGTWGNGNCQIK